MSSKNPKINAINSLRSKILELRTQLENLQKVEIQYSPTRQPSHLKKQNSIDRLATPKRDPRKVFFESPVRVYTRSKSKDHIPQTYTMLKSRSKTKIFKNPETTTDTKRHKIQTVNMNSTLNAKKKSSTLKLDLGRLKRDEELCNNRYQTMFIPHEQSMSHSNSRSQSRSNSSLSRTSTKKFLRLDDDQLQTPRFERQQSIKTYKLPQNNPILNPPESKSPSRRIFAEKNQSPSNIYLNHSGSNPDMFFSPLSYQLIMSNKNRTNRKNISEFMGERIDPSSTKSIKSQEKKHFKKHFNETAGNVIYRH